MLSKQRQPNADVTVFSFQCVFSLNLSCILILFYYECYNILINSEFYYKENKMKHEIFFADKQENPGPDDGTGTNLG